MHDRPPGGPHLAAPYRSLAPAAHRRRAARMEAGAAPARVRTRRRCSRRPADACTWSPPIADFRRAYREVAARPAPRSALSGEVADLKEVYGFGDWTYCWKCDRAISLDDQADNSGYDPARGLFHERCPLEGPMITAAERLARSEWHERRGVPRQRVMPALRWPRLCAAPSTPGSRPSHEVTMETTQSQDLEVVWWPIDKPTPYVRNPRQAPEAAIAKVAASLKEFGFRQPIVVDEEHVVIAGHTRLLAAKQLGLERCRCTSPAASRRSRSRPTASPTTEAPGDHLGLRPAATRADELGDLDYDLDAHRLRPRRDRRLPGRAAPRASPIPTWCPSRPTSRSASPATSTCSASTACSAAMRPTPKTSSA